MKKYPFCVQLEIIKTWEKNVNKIIYNIIYIYSEGWWNQSEGIWNHNFLKISVLPASKQLAIMLKMAAVVLSS